MAKLLMEGASKKFLDHLEKKVFTPLSNGEKRRFEVNGIRDPKGVLRPITATSKGLASNFQVYDFEAQKNIDCYWIDGIVQGDLNSSGGSKYAPGKFSFIKPNLLGYTISSENRGDFELLKFLAIHPQNSDNKNKPYHISPKRYVFSEFNPAKAAMKKIGQFEATRAAANIIDKMDLTERTKLAAEIIGEAKTEALKGTEIKAVLYEIAFTRPDKIVGGTTDAVTTFDDFGTLIKAALDQEVIKRFRHDWRWFGDADDSKPIFKGVANAGGSADSQFTAFLKDNPEILKEIRDRVSLG